MIIAVVILLLVITFLLIINLPVFGSLPKGERLKLITTLPNYSDGAIQNLSLTPMQPEGVNIFDVLKAFIFDKRINTKPKNNLVTVKPDLSINFLNTPELIWFGHSSYLIKVDGLNILVDPVFSKTPSPFSFIGSKAFGGTDFVKAEDFTALDIILITHDHYDHLDYPTILKLASKTKIFICSLGVGSHLEKWGISKDKIIELSWHETVQPFPKLKFTALPARHFTGRKFKRNQTLWSAFAMKTEKFNLFLGGDSGYDIHFKEIGENYGPFDLAVLECGQYNAYWPYIHMFPEQTVQASIDLKARVLIPVHWGKFSLAMHPWDEPINRATKEAENLNVNITIPKLGEKVVLGRKLPITKWWLKN